MFCNAKSFLFSFFFLAIFSHSAEADERTAGENILPAEGRGSFQVSYLGKTIDDMIYEFMRAENIPGLSMAIVQAPYIPRVVGYGLSDIQQKRLASSKTIWAIGPISQAYAAIAIMQLYEAEKLNLTDKAAKYISGLPESWQEITIKQLLQHATGIADYRLQTGYDSSKSYSSPDLITLVKGIPLAFKPGTDVAQSATNFLLLADIVEKVGQMSYHDFVTKHQIEFLKLSETYFLEDFPQIKQEPLSEANFKHTAFLKEQEYINPVENAVGYNQKLERQALNSSSTLKGFGDIWASSEDVSKWDIALAGSLLIKKPEIRALIYSPTTLDNGRVVPAMSGWQFPHHKGLMDIKGSVKGFSAYLSRFTDPKELVCVTLLANKEGLDMTNLARRIASVYGKELSSGYNDNKLYLYESIFDVKETMQRIEQELKKLNIPIFAKFNHSKNAQEAHLDLPPTEVIVFGSPTVGTKLMQENQSIAIELPLKIAVWQDAKGGVWVGFSQMNTLAESYSDTDKNILKNMQSLLEEIVQKGANIY